LFAIGILGTLAILLGSLEIGWISYLLSFLMFLGLVLIWSEIEMQNSEQDTARLMFFKWSLRLSFGLIILYILLKYKALSDMFLFVPLTILFLYIGAELLRKSQKVVRLFKSKKKDDRFASVAISIVMILIALFLGYLLAEPINNLLDKLVQLTL
jgi:hypothetical protein